jgi:uncharacterized SAM-binding protein YcdF (DUF218 family)
LSQTSRRFVSLRLPLIILLALAGLYFTHPLWLEALGGYLVKTDQPARADVALVLAGDGTGRRMLKAAELVREGLAPKISVSGPPGFYGHNEAELAIAFAIRQGNPESWFIPLPVDAHSTREEARYIVPKLRKLGAHSVLLVTSNFHTRRAGNLFRAQGPDLEFRVIAAEDEFFRPAGWWKSREAQERFVLEWMKTISGWLGI